MGSINRHLEHVSVSLGHDGEIDAVVKGCDQHVIFLEERVLREPLTVEQIRDMAKQNADPAAKPELNDEGVIGLIDGIICLSLGDIIAGDIEDFYTNLSERLTGTNMLMDIHYHLLGVDVVTNLLYFRVEGDPSFLLYFREGRNR